MHPALQPGTAERIGNDFHCSLAAIRHRDDVDLRIGLGHFARIERAFEFIGRDQNAHETGFSPEAPLSFRAERSEVEESLIVGW